MLSIHSLFKSISGEVGTIPQGSLAQFIRFQGCNLRCVYCDAQDAQPSKLATSNVASVIEVVKEWNPAVPVILTGGEPLQQNREDINELISGLLGAGFKVQIETNGAIPPTHAINAGLLERVGLVVDFKLPGSGMDHAMPDSSWFAENLPPGSWLKFVMHQKEDAICMLGALARLGYKHELNIAISQTENLAPGFAGEIMLQYWDHLAPHRAVLNVQIHKLFDFE